MNTDVNRLLYVGGFNLPDKNAAAQRVIANAKIFRELGYDVTLVGLDREPREFWYEGFQCVNLQYPQKVSDWFYYLFTINEYEKFLKCHPPKIVVAYNHPAVALQKFVSYCNLNDIKIISDCTEWYTEDGSIIKKTIKDWDTRKRMTDVHLKVDGIISISSFLNDFYNSKDVKSLLLPPLVDINSPKWQCENVEKDEGTIVLTYAGSPGFKDRLDVIVGVINELQNVVSVVFNIIGLDKEQFISLYSYKKHIPNNVHFLGRIPHREVLDYLFKSDYQIFIREDNITTRAGFPTKFVESISAGVPVLTNLTSNIGDYLSEGVNGFPLDASSDDRLKASLMNVLKLPKEQRSKVKNAIDRETFDYKRYIPQFKKFLETL